MCHLLGLSRAGYYRQGRPEPDEKPDQALCQELEKLAGTRRRYGYRRMTQELQQRGWKVNHKRVLKRMREQKLLCRRHPRWIATTDSRHRLPVFENLTRGLKVTGLNQLWVADISYIRLLEGFAYLAVILDAYSRRVIGWALRQTLEAELPLAALCLALRHRRPAAGLIHHSDRGVQYACRAYVELLRAQGIRSSMSRRGNPYDNPIAESFFKTLKTEEVYSCEYQSLGHARQRLSAYIDFYNRQRLHSALGYQPPAEFEARLLGAASSADPSASAE
jgi:transposase InsO family protein